MTFKPEEIRAIMYAGAGRAAGQAAAVEGQRDTSMTLLPIRCEAETTSNVTALETVDTEQKVCSETTEAIKVSPVFGECDTYLTTSKSQQSSISK